jgi:hypothetical protein
MAKVIKGYHKATEKLSKYEVTLSDCILKFDLEKWPSGPIAVINLDPGEEIIKPIIKPISKAISKADSGNSSKVIIDDQSVPKSKRNFINPANGKVVGYARAKYIGIV